MFIALSNTTPLLGDTVEEVIRQSHTMDELHCGGHGYAVVGPEDVREIPRWGSLVPCACGAEARVTDVTDPFVEGDRVAVVATAHCDWCGESHTYRA